MTKFMVVAVLCAMVLNGCSISEIGKNNDKQATEEAKAYEQEEDELEKPHEITLEMEDLVSLSNLIGDKGTTGKAINTVIKLGAKAIDSITYNIDTKTITAKRTNGKEINIKINDKAILEALSKLKDGINIDVE